MFKTENFYSVFLFEPLLLLVLFHDYLLIVSKAVTERSKYPWEFPSGQWQN